MGAGLQTVLTERLGCRWPVIQTAMGWVSTPELVIASSQAGAFGFLAGAVMTPAELKQAIAAVRAGTSASFGVNFHMFQPGSSEIVELILANRDRVRAISFGRGPDAAAIGRFKDAGVLCIPTVGALKHAVKMAELGCDMITVQGGEGGGHTGPVATSILLPQVLDAVKIPVIAAGGFADGRGLAAALAYGAVGVAMGTRFLLTRESPVPEAVKAQYLKTPPEDVVVSTKVDGLPQRMLRNPLFARIERAGPIGRWAQAVRAGLAMKRRTGASWGELMSAAKGMGMPEAILAASAPVLIQRAVVDGDPEGGLMASGQVAGRIKDLPTCAELVERIAAEAAARLAAITGAEPTAPLRAPGRG
jgi:NAD(P)H-dependent flavin oxidoreductase YrpB (nitropropane dioxygenase family)